MMRMWRQENRFVGFGDRPGRTSRGGVGGDDDSAFAAAVAVATCVGLLDEARGWKHAVFFVAVPDAVLGGVGHGGGEESVTGEEGHFEEGRRGGGFAGGFGVVGRRRSLVGGIRVILRCHGRFVCGGGAGEFGRDFGCKGQDGLVE